MDSLKRLELNQLLYRYLLYLLSLTSKYLEVRKIITCKFLLHLV